jgi:plastocyanin
MRRRIGAVVAMTATGLALVVVTPEASLAGGGCHRGYQEGQTEGTGTTVEMRLNCFTPTVLRIAPGTEVTFVNRDPVYHRVDGVGWGGDGEIQAGERVSRRFDAPGVYPFSCMIHMGMTGAVVVGDGAGAGRVVDVTPVSGVAASTTSAETSSGLPTGALAVVALVACLAAYALGGARGARGRRLVKGD